MMEWRVEYDRRFVWLPGKQAIINLDHIVGVEFPRDGTAVVLTTRTGTAWATLTIGREEDIAALQEALGLAVKK